MPSFEEGGQYTGKQILNALENCLDKTDKGEKSMSGDLFLDNSQLNLSDDKTNIITNKLLNEIKSQLDRYVAKFYFNGESWVPSYIYEEIGECPKNKTISVKFKSSGRNCVYNRIIQSRSSYSRLNFKIYNSQGDLILDNQIYSEDLQEKDSDYYYYYVNLENDEEYTIEMQGSKNYGFTLRYAWVKGEEW